MTDLEWKNTNWVLNWSHLGLDAKLIDEMLIDDSYNAIT